MTWDGCLFSKCGTEEINMFLHTFHHASCNAKGVAELNGKPIYSTVWVLQGKFPVITTLMIHPEIQNTGHLYMTEITLKHSLHMLLVRGLRC